MLQDAVEKVGMAKDRGRNQNTARADETGFRWFARACEAFGGTNPVRPTPEEADPEEEAFLSSWVLLFTAMHQKPRSTTTASGVRKDRANPNSSAAMLRGAHRSLAEYGSYVPPMKAVAPVLKGMRTAMIDDFGDDAMAAEQAAAFPQHMLDAMRTNLEICAVPGLSDEECGVASDMLVAGINLGLRKAEYPRYKRSNIQWRDGNKRPLEPTPENIAKAHWMEVTPVCSKGPLEPRQQAVPARAQQPVPSFRAPLHASLRQPGWRPQHILLIAPHDFHHVSYGRHCNGTGQAPFLSLALLPAHHGMQAA